jgi:TolA-binding protein
MTYHDAGDETAQRFASGSLPESEATAFEQHLLTCAQCRDEVRFADQLRRELARPAVARRPWLYVAGAGLAAALLLAVTLPRRGADPRLGAVASAPGYEGLEVRATADAGDSAFAAAMSLYKEGAYRESAEAFRTARALGGDSVTTTFFLGASLLMSGRAQDAADEFGRASRLGPTAYQAESHFYRAKALLRMRSMDEARGELAAATAIESPIRAHALALADSIEGRR